MMPRNHRRVTMPSARDGVCPVCGSPDGLRVVLYGLPAGDVDGKRYVLGGCMMGSDAFRCLACGARFDHEGVDFQELHRSWAAKDRTRQAALLDAHEEKLRKFLAQGKIDTRTFEIEMRLLGRHEDVNDS